MVGKMEDEEEITELTTFEDLKKLALDHEDFYGKFKALKETTVKPENLGSMMQVSQAYMEQLSFELKNIFQISSGAEKDYMVEWTKINAYSSSTIYDGLKSKFEAVAQSNLRLQIVSSQALSYLGVMGEKLSTELNMAYSGKLNIEDDKADRLLKAFEGMQKLLKESEPLMKELKKRKKE